EKDEDLEQAVRRELIEETGFSADHMDHMGDFFLSPPFTKTVGHVFFARNVSRGESVESADAEEIEKVILADQAEIERFIAMGELADFASVASYLIVKNKSRP